MQKRSKLFVLAPLALSALPLFWFACSSQTSVSSAPEVAAALTPEKLQPGFDKTLHPFVEKYCIDCHSGEKAKAELDLSNYKTFASITKDANRWHQVLERVKAKEMPPDDADLVPTEAELKPVVAWLESMHAAEVQRTAGDPGIVLARRLSNAEYDYTIRDLTLVDLKPTKEFPVDPANEAGFDNSGESLAMSPALVQKYLDAARSVANNVVFTPDGLAFADHPALTDEDRDKYAVNRVVDFYNRQGGTIDTRFDTYLGRSLDYADFFVAAWRYQNRAALGRPRATLADFAQEARVSPKYLQTLWTTLTTPAGQAGPLAAIQARWKKLPAPAGKQEPEALRNDAVALRDFVIEVRGLVRMKYANLIPNGRIVATGSQPMVLWKDRQYADNRLAYAGNAATADFAKFAESDPALLKPAAEAALPAYEAEFKRFCAVFPDAFYVTERARMYLSNQRDITTDLEGHRLLTAGFHSMMGYFRDDKPLYDLVLDDAGRKEIDRLWNELEFITQVPYRQYKQYLWYERGEPPSVMVDPVFAAFRPEDEDIISEKKIKQLADVYVTRAEKMVIHIPNAQGGRGASTPLNYIAPTGTAAGTPPPANTTEYRLSPEALDTIRGYYEDMNLRIRALEKALPAAEPLHLKALVAFAERAARRPLAQAEKDDVLGFYQRLRKENLSHEDAIRDSVVSVLMSPAFTYRVNLPTFAAARVAPSGVQALSDYELANRLSYFLWSSMPDQELLSLAAAGKLHQPAVLVAQARRMLRDDRVRALATEFGANWLDIRRFEEHNAVDREYFPNFTNDLREAMFEEPVRFTTDLIQRNGSVLDFVYGKYTFVNAPLAKHYGMPEVKPEQGWVRVDGADKYQRGGLLPMAAFLTKNAPGLRTSPVKRGHWVVTKILGERIPAPPPNVPVLPTDEKQLGELTLRQTLAKHREDKSCATCHNKFDSFGLVFEGFGPVGEARVNDLAGRPAETSAVFPDGSEGAGVTGLQAYIRTKVQHEFVDNLSRKLMAYALGRTLIPSDDLVVAAMRQKLAGSGYRFDALVEEIVTSRQFLQKRISLNSENNLAQ